MFVWCRSKYTSCLAKSWSAHMTITQRKLSSRSTSSTTGSRLLPSCTWHTKWSVLTGQSSPCLALPLSPVILRPASCCDSVNYISHCTGADTRSCTHPIHTRMHYACSQRNTACVLTTRVLSLTHADAHTHRTAQHHMLTSLTHEVLWPWREINYTLILLCSGMLLQKTDVYSGWSLNKTPDFSHLSSP